MARLLDGGTVPSPPTRKERESGARGIVHIRRVAVKEFLNTNQIAERMNVHRKNVIPSEARSIPGLERVLYGFFASF